MSKLIKTDVSEMLEHLGDGNFEQKLAFALSNVGLGTVLFGDGRKKGKVTVEFTFEKIGVKDNQVMIHHKIAHSHPTENGKKAEEDTTESSMFVARGGVLTPEQPKEDDSGQFGLDIQTDGVTKIR